MSSLAAKLRLVAVEICAAVFVTRGAVPERETQLPTFRKAGLQSLVAAFGLNFLAVASRGLAGDALEHDAHVLHVLEARQLRDFLQRKIRLEEKLPDLRHLHAPDLRLRRTPEVTPEFFLQLAARGERVLKNRVHADAVAGVFADEAQSRRDVFVVDREDVARLPRHHAQSLDAPVHLNGFFPRHQQIERLGRVIAGLKSVGRHAGERRIRQLATNRVVVRTQDRNLLGHQQPGGLRGGDDLQRAHVHAGHHADRFRQTLQPGGQRGRLLRIPEGRQVARVFNIEYIAGMAREMKRLDEPVASFTRPDIRREPAEPEVPEPALHEMLGTEMPDTGVVGTDLRHARIWRNVVEVHERDLQLGASFHERGRGVAADHAVPFFAAEPLRIALRARLVVEKGGPRPVRPFVLRDALEHRGALFEPREKNEQDLGFHAGHARQGARDDTRRQCAISAQTFPRRASSCARISIVSF